MELDRDRRVCDTVLLERSVGLVGDREVVAGGGTATPRFLFPSLRLSIHTSTMATISSPQSIARKLPPDTSPLLALPQSSLPIFPALPERNDRSKNRSVGTPRRRPAVSSTMAGARPHPDPHRPPHGPFHPHHLLRY